VDTKFLEELVASIFSDEVFYVTTTFKIVSVNTLIFIQWTQAIPREAKTVVISERNDGLDQLLNCMVYNKLIELLFLLDLNRFIIQ
jgi:hypothetical protein